MKKYAFLLLSLITNTIFCSEEEICTMGGQRIPSPTKFKQYRITSISPTQNDNSCYFFTGRQLTGAEAGAAAAIFNKKN